MNYERITLNDVRPGDLVARTRTGRFEEVALISEGPVARTLYDEDHRIIMRPRRTAKLWRRTNA